MLKLLIVVFAFALAPFAHSQEENIFKGFGIATVIGSNQNGVRDIDGGAFILLESGERGEIEVLERGKIGFLGSSIYLEVEARFIMHQMSAGPMHLILSFKAEAREKMVRIDVPFVPRVGFVTQFPHKGRVGVLMIPLSAYGEQGGASAKIMSGAGVFFVQPLSSDTQFEAYSDYYHTNGLSEQGQGYRLNSGFFVNFNTRWKRHHLELRGEVRYDRTRIEGIPLPSDNEGLEQDALSVFLSAILN